MNPLFKRSSSSIASVCIFSLLCTVPFDAHAKSTWSKEGTDNGVTLYSRPMKGSDIDMYKAVATLPYSPDQVVEILSDIDAYREYMPNVADSRVLKSSKRGDREVIVLYQRLALPTVDDRDFIVRSETWSKSTKLGNAWTIAFESAPNDGPKPVSGVVRVQVVSGEWSLEPIQDGKATRMTITRHVELGGNIPDFMVNKGIRDGLQETVLRLRKRCRETYLK